MERGVSVGVILLDAGGRVVGFSEDGRRWVEQTEFVAELSRAVRTPSVWRRGTASFHIGVAKIRAIRLEEAGGARFVAWVTGAPCPRRERLSPRQRQVADYAIVGATLAEIARVLGCTQETVRSHVREIYRRLNVSSRVELTRALLHVD